MDHLAQTDDIFFTGTNLEQDKAQQIVRQALAGADDGELFLEMRHSEMLAFDDGRLKSASYDQSSGFGLRAIAGEAHGYAHAGELSEAALRRAAASVGAVTKGYNGTAALAPVAGSNRALYDDGNPLNEMPFDAKSACCRKSTPLPEPQTRGWYRSARASPVPGRQCRSCAQMVSAWPTSVPSFGSMCQSLLNRMAAWSPALLELAVG